MYFKPVYLQTRKTTAIKHIAALETSVSRHHGGLIKDSPDTLRTITLLSY